MISTQRGVFMPSPKSRAAVPYLRAWRLSVPLTQVELAERSGVGEATIIRAEQGNPVNAITAARLAKALGVTARQLETEEPK